MSDTSEILAEATSNFAGTRGVSSAAISAQRPPANIGGQLPARGNMSYLSLRRTSFKWTQGKPAQRMVPGVRLEGSQPAGASANGCPLTRCKLCALPLPLAGECQRETDRAAGARSRRVDALAIYAGEFSAGVGRRVQCHSHEHAQLRGNRGSVTDAVSFRAFGRCRSGDADARRRERPQRLCADRLLHGRQPGAEAGRGAGRRRAANI